MYRSLFDMTPLRPELVLVASPQSWAGWEMLLGAVIIVLTFVQKNSPHSFPHGIIGTLAYLWLVIQATFAFAVLWDGANLALHPHTASSKPFLVVAMGLLIMQQVVNLLQRWTTHELILGRTWPLALVETEEWIVDTVGSHAPAWAKTIMGRLRTK